MRCLQVSARLILALWLALAPVKAWAGSMMLLGAGNAGAAAAATATFVSSTSEASGGTTINYGTLNFGTANANRVIAVALVNRSVNTGGTVTSMTIGGIAATQVSGAAQSVAAGNLLSDIWYASVPTGTSGNITVVWVNTVRTGIEVYSIITSTPTPTTSAANNGASLTSVSTPSYTVPTNGVSIAVVGVRNSGGTTSISGSVTQDDVIASLGGAGSSMASGHSTTTGSLTATGSNVSAGAGNMVISAAVWGP